MQEHIETKSWKRRVYEWSHQNAESVKAQWVLAIWSFAESSFFLIPVDVMLVAMLMAGAKRWSYLSGLMAAASVLGGLFGYLIGYAFFDLFGQGIISFYDLEEEFIAAAAYFDKNAFLALLVSAFTPIPYKIFTIAGGVFHVNLVVFTVASIIGRGARFFMVGFIAHLFGERALRLFMKYFNIITIAIIVLAALAFLLF